VLGLLAATQTVFGGFLSECFYSLRKDNWYMSESATISKVYNEIKRLRHDLLEMRYALMPEINLSAKEQKEMHAALREMKEGNERSFSELE
jgi:hypothetical protein